MLPSPSANFTLPSLYDELELDCRLYFPRRKSANGTPQVEGFAIFAHPYAPLGGCYDDPVVNSVGNVLLRQGYLLVTFNFRGADQSPGKTSWSGRGELGDYVSVYTFCLSMINAPGIAEVLSPNAANEPRSKPVLLLGGYSYGSMIATHLPSLEVVRECLLNASEGSPEREIENRAQELGNTFLGFCEVQQLRGRESRKVWDTSAGGGGITMGGYESSDATQRISRDRSHRRVEIDRVRHSVERVRRRLGSHRGDSVGSGQDSGREAAPDTPPAMIVPELRYLLVSPLLGSIASLATMFSRLKFERRSITSARNLPPMAPDDALSGNSSLIIYGTADHFTSSSKVKAWCSRIQARPGSLLRSQEVPGAGHFWHDSTNEKKLIGIVEEWLETSMPMSGHPD